jgi:hypothetical protein
MVDRDKVKARIVDWLLQNGFNQEKTHWEELRDPLLELVSGAFERFGSAVPEMEKRISELPANAGASKQRQVMAEPSVYIAHDIVMDALKEAQGDVPSQASQRLREDLEGHTGNTAQLKKLFAVLRVSLQRARNNDRQHFNRFYRTAQQQKEDHAMADPVELKRFTFDTTSLPENFKDERHQKLFIEAVSRSLEKLGNHSGSYVAATVGLLLVEGQTDYGSPAFFKQIQRLYAELSSSADPNHSQPLNGSQLYVPDGAQRIVIYQHAYKSLTKLLDKDSQLFYQDFARLGRKASDAFKRRPPGSPGFDQMVRTLFLSGVTGDPAGDGSGAGIGRVELPPLSDPNGGGDEIEPDNIRAVATLYVGFQLEQMRFFQVTDRIVELFMAGLLPIGYDEAARKLDRYYWAGEDRLNEAARWSQYSRALGASGGQVSQDVNPNLEFNTLLLRFISSVSEFERQQSIGNLFDQRTVGSRSLSMSAEYVRKAGRDLAANVSLYGWAGTYFAAERVTRQIGKAMEILQLNHVQEAYGVNTPWQVIERVAQREFGTAVNVVKHRTLADETRKILNLVADKHAIWGLSSYRPLFTLERPPEGAAEDSALAGNGGDLSFQETQTLFRAVQYWLAVNGVQDATVDEYRQPTETVASPSLPPLGLNGVGGKDGQAGGAGINQLKDMVSQGQMPSMDQLSNLLSGS